MTQNLKMELYWRLPTFIQEFGLSLYARYLQTIYYGPEYVMWKKRFKTWQHWSWRDSESWQNQQLQSLVHLAATRVPYYRETWKGLNWESVHSAAKLPILPRLTKQTLRQNEHNFLVEGRHPRTLWMEKTSGTTGTALRIYWPMKMVPQWWALHEVMVRNIVGVSQDHPRAMMGGRPIIQGSTIHPPYWRFNKFWSQLYLSSYHVSPTTAPLYIEAIKKYKSEWITGYGSAIAALAENAISASLPSLPLKGVIVSGDTLLPGMRASIEDFFQCKCYDNYGQCEGVCMAMECSYGNMHVIPQAGIIEILREDGAPCQAEEVGEIVATGLLNDAMPLIRYRLGDYAAWAKDKICPCGNTQAIIKSLEGRTDDYLYTSDERKIGRISTALKQAPTVHSAQILQTHPGHAYLLVRPGHGYQPSHASTIRNDILERIGGFDLEVVEVQEIPKTLQGKTPLVVRITDRPELQNVYDKILKKENVKLENLQSIDYGQT